LATVLILEAAFLTLVILGAPVLQALFPSMPGYSVRHVSQSLVLVLIAMAGVLILIATMGWWRLAGFTRPREWRDPHLYWLPAVLLLLVPLVAGAHAVPPDALAMLLVAYLATACYEEAMWRGVQLGLLRRTGIWRAVLVSSVLFGVAHLGNSLLRGLSVIVFAQAFGAAVQGIGLAALRLRTNTIWPLIALHALGDLVLQIGNLPIAMIEPPIDTAMAIYGVILIRRLTRHERPTDAAPRPTDEERHTSRVRH
jgi:membrane protease YdiL (CAAX protease family)